jgi:hypothetical protein
LVYFTPPLFVGIFIAGFSQPCSKRRILAIDV